MRFHLPRSGMALYPHQSQILKAMLPQRHPALLVEMRLGKTVIVSHWLKRLSLRRVLILCPMDAVEGWETTLSAHTLPPVRGYQLSPQNRPQAIQEAWQSKACRPLLMNYEGFVAMGYKHKGERFRSLPDVAFLPWDCVILDESPKIKNPTAQVSELCLKGFRRAKHRMILTGFVAPESLLDVWNQFAFLDGEFMGYDSYWAFRSAYFQQDYTGFGWSPKRGARSKIIDAIQNRAEVMTWEKAGLSKGKEKAVRSVPMNAVQKRLYRRIGKEWAYSDEPENATKFATVKEGWLWKIAGGFDPDNELINPAKADALIELLRGELSGSAAVVWCKYRHEVEYLHKRFRDARIACDSIMGGMNQQTERKPILEAARAGKIRVVVATELTGRFGGDYSFADSSHYYSNEASCEARTQSEERILNVAKPRRILIVDWKSKGSTDEELIQLVQNKRMAGRLAMIEFRRQFAERIKTL